MNIFKPFRKLLGKMRVIRYSNTYTVMVYLRHPLLANSIMKVPVRIDARNKEHAREQLIKELKITVGRAWKS